MLAFILWAFLESPEQSIQVAQSPAQAADQQSPKAQAPSTDIDGIVVTAPRLVPEPTWARKFNFDVRGIYTPSETPYLRVRPIDDCKFMAGGATSPVGRPGAAAGLVCVKRF